MRGRLLLALLVVAALGLEVGACGGQTDQGGGSGGGGTGGTGGSVTGGTGGSGGSNVCDELAQQYSAYLTQARMCNAAINSLQCTLSVGDELGCPCPTYVNPANTDAVAKLAELGKAWSVNPCQVPCPAVLCPQPQGAGCVLNGAGGDADGCVDFWPD